MRTLILVALLLLMGSAVEANTYCGYYRISLNVPTFLEFVTLQGIDPIPGNYGECECPLVDADWPVLRRRVGFRGKWQSCAGFETGWWAAEFIVPQQLFDDGYGPDSIFEIKWCGGGTRWFILTSCD